MISGIELIAAERQRQIEDEGWTAEHDDQHIGESLAMAAACYALPIKKLKMVVRSQREDVSIRGEFPVWELVEYKVPNTWPRSWSPAYWNSKTRLRDLARSAALIAAEMDRLIRLEGFKACPYCGSDIIYRDRCDAARDVAHCDDCGQEFPGDVYRQIIAAHPECTTPGCDGQAEYSDDMDQEICLDCMNERIKDGDDPADFEFIG